MCGKRQIHKFHSGVPYNRCPLWHGSFEYVTAQKYKRYQQISQCRRSMPLRLMNFFFALIERRADGRETGGQIRWLYSNLVEFSSVVLIPISYGIYLRLEISEQ